MAGRLTPKQKTFVEEYLVDLNATQAAIRAGYSVKTAKEIGYENLTKPHISAAIDKKMAERSRRTGVTADRVINEIAKIAFVDPLDVLDLETGEYLNADKDDTTCINSVRVKKIPTDKGVITEREIKLYDKLKALDMLGRHLGLFTDKVEQINRNIEINIGEWDED